MAYSEICNAYHKIDDFRARLLGLLPLASGAGVFLLLRADTGLSGDEDAPYLAVAGLLGLLATLGLYMYELRGIQRCHALIQAGRKLEQCLGLPVVHIRRGPLMEWLARHRMTTERAAGVFSAPDRAYLGQFVGPLGASLLVYVAVLLAWGYLAGVGLGWWSGQPLGGG
jgi:hypothetical protein